MPTMSSSTYTAAFLEWYEAYPRHVGKKHAVKMWQRAVKDIQQERDMGPKTAAAWLLERTRMFARSPEGRGNYCPHPGTWLNKGRYDDEDSEWFRDAVKSDSSIHGQSSRAEAQASWLKVLKVSKTYTQYSQLEDVQRAKSVLTERERRIADDLDTFRKIKSTTEDKLHYVQREYEDRYAQSVEFNHDAAEAIRKLGE